VEHFLEIHNALEKWTKGSKPHRAAKYAGPWIENYWIEHFQVTNSSCLSETFGPFVPLLIPWVDLWVNNAGKYPLGFVDRLQSLLRPNVPYITVSQNDQGLVGEGEMPIWHNIMVLSAGGYGHVPIPLLKQTEPLVNPLENRQWLLSYVGYLGHAPENLRENMHYSLLKAAKGNYTHHYGTKKQGVWRRIMQDSYTSLAPRGFGRTSYHLMEILQSGLVPIHVYLVVPWVPYRTLYEAKLGYLTDLNGLPNLLKRLQNMSRADFERHEAQIVSYRESHFLPSGIMHQIGLYMKYGTGDLECGYLPATVRET
jgi:hypothetical protein